MPRRSPFKREMDLAEEARLYCSGWTQSAIARSLGVDQSVISDDLKLLQKRWQASGVRDLDAQKGEELAKIDNLEREYWEAWERSKSEKQKQKQETRKGSEGYSKGGRGLVDVKVLGLERESRDGDPRFLDGVLKCIERRCKLMGVDAPEKVEHGGPAGGAIPITEVIVYKPSPKPEPPPDPEQE